MSRKEEIKQAAEEHAKSSLVGSLFYKESSFRQGAEWADEHPDKGLWSKEKVIDFLYSNLKCVINIDDFGNVVTDESVWESENYGTLSELVDGLVKAMEE